MSNEESQFDALLGGREELPSSVALASFAACRSQEIQVMKNSLMSHSGTKLAFQTLPKHMRRRAMSHNVKRLPRRLRQIHLNQMKKSGLPAKQKRPSRKYRRRPRNLTEEYTRRSNKKYKWLQTHIWHAKRFHIVKKWGYKLAYRPCDKAFRACYRAMAQHCLLYDMSYYNCLEISGAKHLIVENMKKLSQSNGNLTIGAKAFIEGNREGELALYDIKETLFQRPIGTVNFQWRPKSENNMSNLWLWIHAALYNSVKKIVTNCFSNIHNIVLLELGTELSRFRLTGPLANSVVRDALELVDVNEIDTLESCLEEYVSSPNYKQIITNQCEYWNQIKHLTSTSEISPHLIMSLLVRDPRLNIPKKRTKSVPEFKNYTLCDSSVKISESPLWEREIRSRLHENKITDSEIADMQSQLLVPGSALKNNKALIPIILIQRPGNKKHNIGFGGGWDIILPSIWSKPFWIALVMRGARVGGLRESNSMLFEMGKSQFLQPDTTAGKNEEYQISQANIDNFFKKPPNKRINYNKFKIVSPFSFNWNVLMKDWNNGRTVTDFTVVRDRRVLNSIDLFLNSKTQFTPDYPNNCLIPVKLECEKRGSPSQFAIICLPRCKSDFKGVLAEPNCEDINQQKRKVLREAHQRMLKKLRKQRQLKSKPNNSEAHKEVLLNFSKEIRELWLPEPTIIRNSCSREIIGFVTKGGFSFSCGKSCGTGYISSNALPTLAKFRNRILFRNTNTREYKVAKLSIIVE